MSNFIEKLIVAPMIFVLSMAGYSLTSTEIQKRTIMPPYYVEETEQIIEPTIIEENQTEEITLGADTTLPGGLSTYTLSGAGVNSSATSITLASLTIPQNGYEITDADLSDTFYVTLEPGSRTRQEFISCTTVTQNAGASATLSGCTRGLSPISPYTASSSLQFAHAGGTQVIFSNPPQLYNLYTAKGNDETITGTWTFSASPTVPTPVGATDVVNKTYVDGGILAGAATATESVTGIVRLATAIQGASSTATTANTPYVLQAQNATSTYNSATAPLKIVVTDNSGKIDGNFIDTTDSYSFATTSITIGSGAQGGLVPPGTVVTYASTTAPAGWLLCDGTSYLRTSYPGLFTVIGVGYGSADGTHFNVPDARGRNVLMASTTANIGQKAGESNHTMTEAELVAHTHTTAVNGTTNASTIGGTAFAASGSSASGSTGSSAPFNVLDPYIVMEMIIKY